MSADYSSDEKSVNRDEESYHYIVCVSTFLPTCCRSIFDWEVSTVIIADQLLPSTLIDEVTGEESQVLRSRKGHLLSSAAFVGDLEYPELWSFVDDVRDKQRRRWQRYGAPRLFAAAVSSARWKTDRAVAQRIARIRLLIAETRRKLIVAK